MKSLPEDNFIRHSSDAACRVAEDVIQELAAAEAALIEQLASVEADRDVYRMLAQEGIHALYHQARTLERLRASHDRLLNEFRALRAGQRRQGVAA
jgi:phosphohistidine phosphatase SixA